MNKETLEVIEAASILISSAIMMTSQWKPIVVLGVAVFVMFWYGVARDDN